MLCIDTSASGGTAPASALVLPPLSLPPVLPPLGAPPEPEAAGFALLLEQPAAHALARQNKTTDEAKRLFIE